MTTAASLIADTRRHLESYHRGPRNLLAASVDADDTSLSFTYDIEQIQAGAYLELGLELVYVWSVDTASKTATVQRAQQGSTAASHAAGTQATVNPAFPDFAVFRALNDELRSLSSPVNGLFAVRSLDLTASPVTGAYDLTGATDVLEILQVRHQHPGTAQWSTLSNYELTHGAGSGFASGTSLTFHDGLHTGRTVRVLYKASFDPLVNLTDDVESVAGLPEAMHDIPPLGAAMRLVAPREVRRNQIESQGDSRRAGEVPAGAIQSSMRGLAALRQQRITEQAAVLAQQYPDRSFTPVGPMVW